MAWQFFALAALSLAQGASEASAARKSGAASRDASYANAEDFREIGDFNYESIIAAADYNADVVEDIGDLNAEYIEASTERNLMLYGMEADEDIRRHLRAEKQNAGEIRAMASGSGIQVNTGTPLHYLNSQIDEGIRQRRYNIVRHYETMETMSEDGADRAFVTRKTSEGNASVIRMNGQTSASMALADANMRAEQSERAGDVAAATGNAQASSAILGGITSAAQYGMAGSSTTPTTTTTGGGYSFTPSYIPSTYNAYDPKVVQPVDTARF